MEFTVNSSYTVVQIYALEVVVSICNPQIDWFRATVRIFTPRETNHPGEEVKKQRRLSISSLPPHKNKLFFMSRPTPLLTSVRLWLKYFENFFTHDNLLIIEIKDIVQPKKRGVKRGTIRTVLTSYTIADIF
jgi:hypothetical protein